ncbi:MAG: hypothetical protein KGV44_14295 [Flavobacteriaceae bacterium]|nr:hypothetical protein [Flavobacteriaceae bacterium]
MSKIYLGVFGTFGNPHGSTQTFYNQEHRKIGLPIKTFDIITSAIQLYPQTSMYLFRKEKVKDIPVISYAIYSYAQEKGSTRGGTYVGSSIVSLDALLEEKQVLSFLNKFHQSLINNPKNILNGNIEIKHSDEYTIDNFYNFENLKILPKKCADINFNVRNKSLLVHCRLSKLQDFFSLSSELFNLYDAVYFTENKKIVENVEQKGLFDIIDEKGFNNLLNLATKERVKQCENIKKQTSLWSKSITDKVNENKEIVKNNKQIHQQNEISISKMEKETQQTATLVTKNFEEINDLVRQLQTTPVPSYSKIEEIKNRIEQKRQSLDNELRAIKGLPQIARTSKPKPVHIPTPRFEIEEEVKTTNSNPTIPTEVAYRKPKENKKKLILLGIAIATLLVVFLSIMGGIYCYKLCFGNDKKQTINKETVFENSHKNTKCTKCCAKNKLSANNVLNENDCNNVTSQLKLNMSISEVVNVIYDKNPTDISKPFKDEKTEYSKLLYQKNEDCFEVQDNDTILIDTKLKKIPSK